jgi:hypothetical protein
MAERSIVPLNTDEIANMIRYWVHFDDAIHEANKQVSNLRKLRNTYEEQILKKLADARQEQAIIQIVGGRLSVIEEKQTQPLSFKSLETALHEYYRQKRRPDETAELLKFIRTQREFTMQKSLKRQQNK